MCGLLWPLCAASRASSSQDIVGSHLKSEQEMPAALRCGGVGLSTIIASATIFLEECLKAADDGAVLGDRSIGWSVAPACIFAIPRRPSNPVQLLEQIQRKDRGQRKAYRRHEYYFHRGVHGCVGGFYRVSLVGDQELGQRCRRSHPTAIASIRLLRHHRQKVSTASTHSDPIRNLIRN